MPVGIGLMLVLGVWAGGRAEASNEPAVDAELVGDWVLHTVVDTVVRDESLAMVLARSGVHAPDSLANLIAHAGVIPSGSIVEMRGVVNDTLPWPSGVRVRRGTAPEIVANRETTGGTWDISLHEYKWRMETLSIAGEILPGDSLIDALRRAQPELAATYQVGLADGLGRIFGARIGDQLSGGTASKPARFALLVEQEVALNSPGTFRLGRIRAAGLRTDKGAIKAILFPDPSGRLVYYDQDGVRYVQSRGTLPVANAAVSSRFSLRRAHPILGTVRPHSGTDYAAPLGMPVKSALPGTVTFAGTRGGYGQLVIVRHSGGWESRYGHLSRIAPTTRVGQWVNTGQLIGLVGESGLATGPHLHFELRYNGVAVDPQMQRVGASVPEFVRNDSRVQWGSVREATLNMLDPLLSDSITAPMPGDE